MTNFIIESNVEIPEACSCIAPREKSHFRRALEQLTPGLCLTVPLPTDKKEQKAEAARLRAVTYTAQRENNTSFTTRTMFGEVKGRIIPVFRVWRN